MSLKKTSKVNFAAVETTYGESPGAKTDIEMLSVSGGTASTIVEGSAETAINFRMDCPSCGEGISVQIRYNEDAPPHSRWMSVDEMLPERVYYHPHWYRG